ncbi:MAG: hypothetical protein KDE47_15465 [Caldilineaceae bacterium]|nr:hypothetical protein [Caldilineaceae bacterium]
MKNPATRDMVLRQNSAGPQQVSQHNRVRIMAEYSSPQYRIATLPTGIQNSRTTYVTAMQQQEMVHRQHFIFTMATAQYWTPKLARDKMHE